jgi:hypothetical protein
MFGKILTPVVMQNCGQVAIEEFKVSGQKEVRIINTLEPIMSQHRLVMDTQVLLNKDNQIQITRMQEKRGALKHDDRVDVLAAAVSYWTDALAIDPEKEMVVRQEEDYKNKVKEWMSNKRSLGILGDRISGAVLLNGKEPKEKKFGKSILRRKR